MKRSSLTKRGGAAVGVAGAVALAFMAPTTAFANPADEPVPNPEVLTSSNSAFVVPDGVCSVDVIVAGAPGGQAVTGEPGANGHGAGGVLGATLDVKAGDEIDVLVGTSGGDGGGPGEPGGGAGGSGSGHPGGGGGGYSSISVGGDLLLLAGGGGGTGGGHDVVYGQGGDAGSSDTGALPVGDGLVFPGNDGNRGWDNGGDDSWPGGGLGGSNVGGPGGMHTDDSSLNGFDGDERLGGNGGTETGLDTGGGGGAGYFGGGGGASTDGDGGSNTGGGGGGGSSFASDSGLIDSDTLTVSVNRDGDDLPLSAYVSFEYTMCDYELAVSKSVVGVVDQAGTEGELIRTNPVFESGDIVRYEVTVTNVAGDDMGVGNTVTLIDDLAAGGTVVSVNGVNTVDPAVDGTIPANGDGDGVIGLYDVVDLNDDPSDPRFANRGLDLGGSVTVVYDVEVQGDAVVTNNVSVADPNGVQTADAVVDPADPSLSLVKSADAKKATTVGQEITYSFLVTNTGNIEVQNIEIVEGEFSGEGTLPDPVCPVTELDPGESTTCTSVYTVVAGDLTGNDLENTATAVGQTPGGMEVESNESSVEVPSEKPAPAPVQPLAHTGGDNSMLLYGGVALLLLLAGGTAVAIAARRSTVSAE